MAGKSSQNQNTGKGQGQSESDSDDVTVAFAQFFERLIGKSLAVSGRVTVDKSIVAEVSTPSVVEYSG